MKKALYTTFTILIFLVLGAKVLNWILNFSDETNQVLNTAMFTLIGIAYLVMGYVWDGLLLKVIITVCGLFLIARNFIGSNVTLDILVVVCIITPMLIAR